MDDAPVVRGGDQQADVVPAQAADFGRLVRLEPCGELERERRAHPATPAISRAR